MTWLYVVLVSVVVAAVPGTVWLKRVGDRRWREHRQRELLRPIGQAFIDVRIEFLSRMTPALQKVIREMDRTTAQLERSMADNPGLRDLAREVAKLQRRRPIDRFTVRKRDRL